MDEPWQVRVRDPGKLHELSIFTHLTWCSILQDIQGLAGHHYQLLQDAVEDSRQWDVEEGEQTQLVKFFGNCR